MGTHVDARGSQCDTAVLEEEPVAFIVVWSKSVPSLGRLHCIQHCVPRTHHGFPVWRREPPLPPALHDVTLSSWMGLDVSSPRTWRIWSQTSKSTRLEAPRLRGGPVVSLPVPSGATMVCAPASLPHLYNSAALPPTLLSSQPIIFCFQGGCSVASGDTGCRAAGLPPSQGGCLPPRTQAGSAGSAGTEQGAGTLQAVMDQTSPPTEVKANEETRQARRRGVKTPASSHETEAVASFGSCRLPEPQPDLSPTPPSLCWTGGHTCVQRPPRLVSPAPMGCPPSLRWAGWSAE